VTTASVTHPPENPNSPDRSDDLKIKIAPCLHKVVTQSNGSQQHFIALCNGKYNIG